MKERLSSALGAKASSVEASTLTYAASLVCQLCNFKNWMASEWTKVVTPYLAAFVSQEEAQGAVTSLLTQSKEDAEKEAAVSCGSCLSCWKLWFLSLFIILSKRNEVTHSKEIIKL
jgi:hypothetical protein